MVNGAFYFHAGAGDFAFQRRDPHFQLGYRQRIEILPRELCEQIVGTGKCVVQVHDRQR